MCCVSNYIFALHTKEECASAEALFSTGEGGEGRFLHSISVRLESGGGEKSKEGGGGSDTFLSISNEFRRRRGRRVFPPPPKGGRLILLGTMLYTRGASLYPAPLPCSQLCK